MHAATGRWVSCGLERFSGGSGWRGCLYTFIPPAPAGSRLAAHARPGHRRRPGVPPPARLPLRHSPGRGVGWRTSVATAGAPRLRERERAALPLSPARPGRCRRHADSDTSFRSGRSVTCAIGDSSSPSLAPSIFSPAPATPAHPCPALHRAPPVSPALLPSSFLFSRARTRT
jgi:hypothetical protein